MQALPLLIAGGCAGAVNGLLGGGGGMLLVPMLTGFCHMDDESLFPASLSIIFPICIVSLLLSGSFAKLPFHAAVPYLLGSALGGVAAGLAGHKLSTKILHRLLGCLILLGGIRNLC